MDGTKTGQFGRRISFIGFATSGMSGAVLGGLGGPTLAGVGLVLGFVAAIVLWIPLLVIGNASYSVLCSKIGHIAAAVLVSCVLAGIAPSPVFLGCLGFLSSGNTGTAFPVLNLGSAFDLVPAGIAGVLTFFFLRNVQQEL